MALTVSVPGTLTVAGTRTASAPAVSATFQVPAPPPASVSSTCACAEADGRRRPNETALGLAKTRGVAARARSIRPPPTRVGGASAPFQMAGRAVRTSADRSCCTVQDGLRARSRATPPLTCGAAMLVPEKRVHVPSLAGTDERMFDPGAATSGFIRSDLGVGPADEKLETTSARPDSRGRDRRRP